MAEVRIEHLTKSYGSLRAVDDVSLVVKDGEFFTLLGPSGCGKSTLLGMLAGLEVPTAGSIDVGDRMVYSSERGIFVPPERRSGGLVFQSYALWPHMTVYENLAFALRLRSVKGAAQRAKIADALDLVEMGEYAGRYPHELSGGQQQRVALSRTLVYEPDLLLLDEPLSNLDAILRDRARVWLRELHDAVGVTTIYVTHDQAEALALSDRIAVLQAGRVLQVADPVELYERPTDLAVAEFIGTTDVLQATVVEVGAAEVELDLAGTGDDGRIVLPRTCFSDAPAAGLVASIVVRPDWIRMADASDGSAASTQLDAAVVSSSYLGGHWQHLLQAGDSTMRATTGGRIDANDVRIEFDTSRIRVFVPAVEGAPLQTHLTAF